MSVAEDNAIILKGIKVNNLQNIDVLIPRNQLTVVTGVCRRCCFGGHY